MAEASYVWKDQERGYIWVHSLFHHLFTQSSASLRQVLKYWSLDALRLKATVDRETSNSKSNFVVYCFRINLRIFQGYIHVRIKILIINKTTTDMTLHFFFSGNAKDFLKIKILRLSARQGIKLNKNTTGNCYWS